MFIFNKEALFSETLHMNVVCIVNVYIKYIFEVPAGVSLDFH